MLIRLKLQKNSVVYTGISDKITEKLNKIIDDQKELDMIIELLKKERKHVVRKDPPPVKAEFQLLLKQYFPMDDQE